MREIKFRALDKERKELGYFTLLQLQQGQASEIWTKFENWCEYTGLKDKNGKEIYEGDILKDSNHYPYGFKHELPEQKGEVVFDTKMGGWYIGQGNKLTLQEATVSTRAIEVIGNIYENPELL